ncbi:LysR substrate-binding domain-containing protein [Streptomyces sp. NPDC024017]|uniref:LysR substrate-binding domain-containing protein n=1 Tax=Streptomyces sp. NPDC024017 TaxID=3154326 RepID=UPI0034094806
MRARTWSAAPWLSWPSRPNVACFSTLAAVHVVPALRTGRERYPDLQVSLHELEPPEALSALRARRCEVAVCYSYNLTPTPAPAPAELDVRPLTVEPVLLALPAGHACASDGDGRSVDLRSLTDAPWIVGSREDGSAALVQRACAIAGFPPEITHAVDDYQLVLRMVAHGLGVALVPQLVAHAHGPSLDVVLRPVANTELTRAIYAMTHPSLGARPPIDAVLDLLRTL